MAKQRGHPKKQVGTKTVPSAGGGVKKKRGRPSGGRTSGTSDVQRQSTFFTST